MSRVAVFVAPITGQGHEVQVSMRTAQSTSQGARYSSADRLRVPE